MASGIRATVYRPYPWLCKDWRMNLMSRSASIVPYSGSRSSAIEPSASSLEKNGDFLRADAVVSNLDAISTAPLPAAGERDRAARSPQPGSDPDVQLRLHHAAWHPRDFPQPCPTTTSSFLRIIRREFEAVFRRGVMPEGPKHHIERQLQIRAPARASQSGELVDPGQRAANLGENSTGRRRAPPFAIASCPASKGDTGWIYATAFASKNI